MTRTDWEKRTVRQMIGIYCRAKHGSGKELCEDCARLYDYACARLDNCRFGKRKTFCSKCRSHCYKPAMREQIRQVMRYAGPRMLWHDPIAALRHLIGK